ncbi:MAG: class I SAM-dependent methyltransferase [Alphaproteobacteria bacterium]|nr:class I SAM-dependent methyltransferase [Alphaproteobacteria bacterium]
MDVEKLFDPDLVLRNGRRAHAMQTPDADFLAKIVAEEMQDRLSVVERTFDHAIILHGHSGLMAQRVRDSGKAHRVTRLEQHADFLEPPIQGVEDGVTDLETMSVADASIGLVVSPLSMHLVNDLPGLLLQIRRSLHPDGLLLAALPGTGTLAELRDSLLQAETDLTGGVSPRVMPFADVRDCGALLQRAGFALPVVDRESYTVRYDTMFDLMKDLRAMGMTNPLMARSRKPATRALFSQAAQTYSERYSDPDGRIRATFQILYLSGWAPHESQQKPLKPGSADISLARVLGQDQGNRGK